MARTTSDPKRLLVTIRLNAADLKLLDRVAKDWSATRSEVLRRLLRQTEKTKAKKKE